MILDPFEDYLLVDLSLSHKTVEVYLQVVNEFLKFAGAESLDDIETLKRFYFTRNLSSRTMCKYASALNSFFNFKMRSGEISTNPQSFFDRVKIEKKLVKSISDSQVDEFLSHIPDSSKLSLRDKCIFYVMYTTGCRVSELVNISISDVDFNAGSVKLKGKRSKERLVPMCPSALRLLEDYISSERRGYDKKNSKYLFLSIRGDGLTRGEVWYRMKKYSVDLNFSLHPHVLRHTFATTMLKNDTNIATLRDILGHSSIATTQIYTQIDDRRVKAEYLRVFEGLF